MCAPVISLKKIFSQNPAHDFLVLVIYKTISQVISSFTSKLAWNFQAKSDFFFLRSSLDQNINFYNNNFFLF